MTNRQHQFVNWPFVPYPTAALRGGGGSSAPVSDPNVTAIPANGWGATYTTPPAEFDPVSDAKLIYATRPGFTAAGGSTTLTDTITIMKRVRDPYPDENDLTANDVSLSDFVFSGDTLTGITNNSTVDYHKPICMMLGHDRDRVTDQTYTARVAIAHWAARNGKPVAAVEFFATDGVTTVSTLVSSMSTITYTHGSGATETSKTIPHYAGSLDFSTLSDDSLITVYVKIYTWVGDTAYDSRTDFATYPSINFCEFKIFNAVTTAEDTIYAYIDGVGAGTPAVSTNPATAATTPFANGPAATAAIQAADGANVSRGIIRINAGVTVTHASLASYAVGDTPLIIEGVDRATSVYQDSGANTFDSVPHRLKFKNLTIKRGASSSVIFIDDTGMTEFICEDCTFDKSARTSLNSYWFHRTGRTWLIGCNGDGENVANSGAGTATKTTNVIGCALDLVQANTVYNAVGFDFDDTEYLIDIGSVREAPNGQFFGFGHMTSYNGSPSTFAVEAVIGTGGLALVGLVLERTLTGVNPVLGISQNTTSAAAQNLVMQLCTFVGDRTNILYNDATQHAAKSGQAFGCVFWEINTKSDVYATTTAAVGNWPVLYKVGWRNNAYLQGSSSTDAYGPGEWAGEIGAIGDVLGTNAAPIDPDWVDDQSSTGGAAGGGDYRPGGSTALSTLAAGLAPYPFDFNGTAVPDDGTAIIGALQP